ncbi:D-2-hydroxyacid dehydrogenase [Hwanghaeella sp.]|uniref:D-2-hydroxyacid dehydrogenase n=1 Tax=Hwanghaeella sp. TaxID=2605943 RepID=UPI003CCC255B
MSEGAVPRVLIVSDEAEAFLSPCMSRLENTDYRVCSKPEAIQSALRDFSPSVVFVAPGSGMPKSALRQVVDFSSVQWVSNAGAGVEHLTPWDPSSVSVTNAAGVLSEFLAEYTISALQMANVGFPQLMAQQRRSEWAQHAWTPIAGKTISIVGLGHVGRAVARRAKALGMHVIGVRSRKVETPCVDLLLPVNRLCNAMARADFVSVHAAETPDTRGMIGRSAFACMARGTVLLNASRGPLVDDEALLEALDNGKVSCAILDVFNQEPLPAGHPYWTHDKVVMSPHMADYVPDWQGRMFGAFLDNLDRYRRGETLANIVDPVRGY